MNRNTEINNWRVPKTNQVMLNNTNKSSSWRTPREEWPKLEYKNQKNDYFRKNNNILNQKINQNTDFNKKKNESRVPFIKQEFGPITNGSKDIIISEPIKVIKKDSLNSSNATEANASIDLISDSNPIKAIKQETLYFYNTTNNTQATVRTDITREQMKILYEEPLNTTNPLKALLGYVPKDDERICRFSENGECFKKSRCLLDHETKLSDGFTKDKEKVTISSRNEPTVPGINEEFFIIPTTFEECGNKFYGQVVSRDLTDFVDLMNKINDSEEIKSYRTYPHDVIPTLAELILAKYKDGLFYRARIVYHPCDIENPNSVLVYFVDYGNTSLVRIEDIRKWKPEFETVPFQAINFTLDGVKPKDKKELKITLEKYLCNIKLRAVLVNFFESAYVKIFDEDNIEINETLINIDLCERTGNYYYNSNTKNSRIPG